MNARDFFYLVSNMRQAQTTYFRTRDQKDLRYARHLEGEVDAEIRRVKYILEDQAYEISGQQPGRGQELGNNGRQQALRTAGDD